MPVGPRATDEWTKREWKKATTWIKRDDGTRFTADELNDQFTEYAPEVLESFQKLVDTGCVELLDETYHHSLAALYSEDEFKEQVKLHRKKIKSIFGYKPKVFRNTELVYNNRIAYLAEQMGYKGKGRSSNFLVASRKQPASFWATRRRKRKERLRRPRARFKIASQDEEQRGLREQASEKKKNKAGGASWW